MFGIVCLSFSGLDTSVTIIEDGFMMEISKDGFNPLQWWLESKPWEKSRITGLTGLKGSSKAYVLSHWQEEFKGPLLILVPNLAAAESLVEDLQFFQRDTQASILLFPPWETLPYDEIPPHPEIVRERVMALFALARGEKVVLVAPVRAMMQKVLPPLSLSEFTLPLIVGEEVDRDKLIHFLSRGGYTSVKKVEERGDFSLRGAIVDIFSPLYEEPLRLEFIGDQLESVRRFDMETQRIVGSCIVGSPILCSLCVKVLN